LLPGFSIPYSTRISCDIRAHSARLVAKVKHAISAQGLPEAPQPDSAEESQLAKNQHQERPSKHPRQESKSFARHLWSIFFGLFSGKQMAFPRTWRFQERGVVQQNPTYGLTPF
jgi:hypothetical protein